MGSYSQWRASFDAGERRRVTWVAGDQAVLIEDVVETTRKKLEVASTMNYVSLSFEANYDRTVWAEVNQHPFEPGATRLVVIRDADKLTRWEQLGLWLSRTRSLPGVYLVFVSGETDLPSTGTGNRKQLKPHVAQLKAPRGYLVRCATLNEPDALAWIRQRATVSDEVARHLLTRTGGSLDQAAAVCAKLSLFDQAAGVATIDALVEETPTASFTDSLIAGDKRHALLALGSVRADNYCRAVALLDSRLDVLHKLHRIQIAGRSWRDSTGVNPYLSRQYLPYAKNYDASVCAHRRRVLASIDTVLRTGARQAVMEALVAAW